MPENRNYKVVRGIVGAFPQGHAFTESEFRRLYPPPAGVTGEDAEAYHGDNLRRLIDLGVVVRVDEPATAPAPLGPENRTKPPEAPKPAAANVPQPQTGTRVQAAGDADPRGRK